MARRASLALTLAACLLGGVAARAAAEGEPARRFPILEYRVKGARNLPRVDVESAVYRFLGPDRTERDIERARAALERAYADAGLQTVGVSVPQQDVSSGIVELRVIERPIGRLRVTGARFSSARRIRSQAPSLQEGRVLNFNDVPRDLAALNQLPDRRITPALKAGALPDTVDVDLQVEETRPLHASVEVNNRQQPGTKALRANVSVSANNLAQSGNSLGFSYQTAPQEPSQVRVYSGYYLWRSPGVEWLNLLVQGTKQDSNVSTLGGSAVVGRGHSAGIRMLFNLPAVGDYTQSASFGFDYKKFNQKLNLPASSGSPATTIETPITYYPLVAGYNGAWQSRDHRVMTTAGATAAFHFRGLGSNDALFNQNRYNASGNFLVLQGDLAHTREIGAGFQAYGRLHGQIADQALLSREQITGGGVDTVRGYLEAETVGDSGVFGTVELRSPTLLKSVAGLKADWRVLAFVDSGWLKVIDPLPAQKNHFDLLSFGLGSTVQLSDHFNASVYASLPRLKQGETKSGDLRVLFQGTLNY